MDELDAEMKMSFIDEARQLLESAEQCFLDLESSGGGPEVIENLFRLAHNMKGTSRAVGFGEVAEFTHQLENLLLKIKEGKQAVDAETVNLLLECNDHLKAMVEALSVDLNAKFDSGELIEKIVTKLAGGSISVDVSGNADEAHTEGGSSEHHDSSVSDWPEPPQPELFNPFDEETSSSALAEAAAKFEMSDLPASNELKSTDTFVPEAASALVSQTSPAAPAKAAQPSSSSSSSAPAQDESIRVSLSRLEKLSDFIGELVILQTVLNQQRAEIPSQLLQRTIGQLGKLSKEIQDISMSLRMIPIKQTFAKLQRIVRDTSKTLGKQVELVLEGEQTEVDKTVLEQVADPLVHIVRNAIDHGLEMPEERLLSGKASAGRVVIRALHQGNNLVIEIQDDGKGIDPQKLIKIATSKGILKPGAVMSDSDAFMLLFAPGFSTKDQVSEISGRGVGLDVVKTNVERLGGQVQLESTIGNGSLFKIILPLTLAIIDGMVVQVGEERYVVPVANVHETVQPRSEDVHFVTGRGEMLNLRDQVLPLVRLSAILKTPGNSKSLKPICDSIAIIVNTRKAPFAVLVDDILRQQQIVIKKLGAEIRVQKGLTGSAILGDGKPALILDLNDLVDRVQTTSGPASFSTAQAS